MILNRLFSSTESLAKNIAQDDAVLLKSFQEYTHSVLEKGQLIINLQQSYDQRSAILQRLDQLLQLDLADVHTATEDDNEIIHDLQALEHSDRMWELSRLERTLHYYGVRFEYVHQLLSHLYTALKGEGRLVARLMAVSDLREFRKLVIELRLEFDAESATLKKLSDIMILPEIFLALVNGEHIIHRMDSKGKKLVSSMQKYMGGKFLPTDLPYGVTYRWVTAVFYSLDETFRKLVADSMIDHHADVNLELVNRSEFVDLAKEAIRKIKGKDVPSQMIDAFVHFFRDWYNHEID